VTNRLNSVFPSKIRKRSKAVMMALAGGLFVCLLTVSLFVILRRASPSYGIISNLGPEWNRLKYCRTVPEYNRLMNKAVISVSCKETTLGIQHRILSCLPDYTEILLFSPKTCLEPVKTWLADKQYADRIEFVAYDGQHKIDRRFYLLFRDKEDLQPCDLGDYYFYGQFGTLWAQDLFEVTTDSNGQITLLSPCVHRYFSSLGPKSDASTEPDNRCLSRLSAVGIEVLRLPLAFKGGNILVDEIGDKRVVFCGGDVLRTTRTVWQALTGRKPSESTINGILKNALNADKVVIIGFKRLQPCLMYHLDQAMVILPNGHAGVARIVGGQNSAEMNPEEIKEVKLFLSELRAVLKNLGYKILDIEMSVHNLLHYQHYVNVIPYIDAKTGQRTLLMPIFLPAQSAFDEEIIKRNKATYESLGYKVISVPTKSYEFKGGIHCLLNVLE